MRQKWGLSPVMQMVSRLLTGEQSCAACMTGRQGGSTTVSCQLRWLTAHASAAHASAVHDTGLAWLKCGALTNWLTCLTGRQSSRGRGCVLAQSAPFACTN